MLNSPLLRIAMLTYLFIPGVFIGTQLVSILYLHQLGLSPTQTGALMVPWALASAFGIALSRYRFNRTGPKPLLLMGFGGSLCSSTAQNTAFMDVPADRMGHASAVWNLNRQMSFLLGPAVMMAVFAALTAITSTPHAYALCFAIGAALTLLPLLAVLRLDTPRVLALLAH